MSIQRAPRPQGNFYILDKSISEDRRLSWAARGLLVYLLGKPDHWQVSTAALVNETNASRLHSGRDSVRSLLGELIDAGYMTRTPARDSAGKVAGYDYTVSEICVQPGTDNPAPAEPGPAEPAPVEPGPANPPQASTDSLTSIEKAASTDLLGDVPPPAPAARQVVASRRKQPTEPAPTNAIWEAYAFAYERRYSVPPVRNAKVNGQLTNLLTRLGAEEAPAVAAFFVGHNNRYYVQKMHSVDSLIADAEKLRTEWATGRRVTQTAAQEADRLQETGDMWNRIVDEHERTEG